MKQLLKFFLTIILAVAFSIPAVAQVDETGFRAVQKWAVSYDDHAFDRVEGYAYCNWAHGDCELTLIDPMSYDKIKYQARSASLPYSDDGPIQLHFQPKNDSEHWPSAYIAKDPTHITGDHLVSGGAASLTIDLTKGKKPELGALGEDAPADAPAEEVSAPSSPVAGMDWNSVDFTLRQQTDGVLNGSWHYMADPQTRRHGDGTGPSGIFEFVEETAATAGKGGMRAVQYGGLRWKPLPPRIVTAEVLEDQAAFNGSQPKYTHPRRSEERRVPILGAREDQPQTTFSTEQKNLRTLVIFGQDLPLRYYDANKSVKPIGGADGELEYEILAVYEHGHDENDVRVGRIRKALTKQMDGATATAFGNLDSAVVQVWLRESADAGEKKFGWGGAEGKWNLQFGDNIADVRIVRPVSEGTVETVPQLALPEQVMLETEVGSRIADETLPLQFQYSDPTQGPIIIRMTAARVAGHPTLYRTAPFVVTDPASAPRAAKVAGAKITVVKGAPVRAGVERSKTHFLRSGIAQVVADGPDALWLNTLKKAASCDSKTIDDKKWQAFARTPAETVTWTFGTKHGSNAIPITFGDHAAMLLLRDDFVRSMESQLRELNNVSAQDDLTDAWYRSMHDAVTQIQDYPLADFSVASPAGSVPFRKAYDDSFAEETFHVFSTVDGAGNSAKWRREASRAAIGFLTGQMQQTLNETMAIPDCERGTLLGLTGNGFQHISARIAPRLMMLRQPDEEGYTPGNELAQPARLARSYVATLEQTAAAVNALKELSTTTNTAVVALALTLVVPGAGALWGDAAGALAGVIGGLAVTSYDAGWQIYNTYHEHEEVRFAFSSVSALGFDRYFDAAARATPWWQTGLLIFTEAVLQGYSMKISAQPISEGLSAWRGERLALQRNIKTLSVVRGLTEEEQRDLAMFFFKEQEAAARGSVMSDIRNLAQRVFSRLGVEARGAVPVSEAGNIAPALEAEAAEIESGAAQAGKKDAVKALKDEAAAGDLLSRGRQQTGAQALAEAGEAEGAAVVEAVKGQLPKQLKPWPTYRGMPVAPGKWSTVLRGRRVVFEVEEFLAEGEMCAVYKLKKPPEGVDVSSLGNDLVLKIVKNPQDIEAFSSIPEARQNILQRMIRARDLLKQAKIPQADFIAAENSGENAGVILQKRIKIEKFPEMTSAGAEQGKRLAIVKLYKQLSDNGLVWLDGHVDNIFLEQEGGQWVAKILDQDLLTRFEDLQRDGIYKKMLEYVQGNAARSDFVPLGEGYTTARGVNLKMLELKGWAHGRWIDFSMSKKAYMPGLLAPEDIWSVFTDLPYTRPDSMPH